MSIRTLYGKASTVGFGLLIGVLLTVLSSIALGWTASAGPRNPTIIEFQFAGDERIVTDLLGANVQEMDDRISALRSSIKRDWLLIAAYVSTLVWWCAYGRQHFRMRYARALALVLAWSAVIAGVADAVENFWLNKLIDARGAHDTAATWVTAFAIPKWLLLAFVVPVAFTAFFTGVGRLFRRPIRRYARFWRHLPLFGERILPAFAGAPRQPWARPDDDSRCDWNTTVDPPLKARRKPVVGVCFSGGGIRSATFNMGVLQALSKTPAPKGLGDENGVSVLQRTDLLSCVSGGAYIAGALQILAHQTEAESEPPTFQPCSPEENHLRLHGRYLADNVGEWLAAIARVVAGTLLNLLIFSLILFVLARPLGWVQNDLLFNVDDAVDTALKTTDAMWFGVGWTAAIGLLVLLFGTLVGGVEGTLRSKVHTAAFGFLALSAVVLLMVWLLPTLARVVPNWVENLGRLLPWGDDAEAQTGATVLIVAGGGSLAGSALAIINRPTPTPENAKTPRWPALRTMKKWIASALPYVAGLLLGVIALVAFAVFTSQAAGAGWDGRRSFFGVNQKLEGPVWLCAVALLALLYALADQTRWSLGPFYRRRLATAFAIQLCGAERKRAGELPWSVPTTLSKFAKPHPKLPEVLVCAAANLSEQSSAPPGRRVASFVFGAEVVGGPEVGWAATRDFEAVCTGPIRSDSTFLAAMAISGAAFASAMGRHSKGAVNSLLAASNARLGVWLPSPRYVAEFRRQTPEPQYDHVADSYYGGPWVRRRRFSYLLKELFGVYSREDRFVYLTDGGHYENLGLVELLRRKCGVILCFDASGDDLITCGTFVEALTLAEEELGVDVRIHLSELAPRADASPQPGALTALNGRLSERSVVRGTITYKDGTTGQLILAKASLTKETPAVVLAHAARQKKATFPNDSTGDQFFDHSQFNAYAELGRHIGTEAAQELEDVVSGTASEPSPIPNAFESSPPAPMPSSVTPQAIDLWTRLARCLKALVAR